MAQLSNLELSVNGECLYCTVRNGYEFEEITAEDFAYDFEEEAFSLIRDYWRRSNKTPSIRYRARLLTSYRDYCARKTTRAHNSHAKN